MYKTIKELNIGEIVVEKSRFIAAVMPVSSESMANEFIEKRRKENYAAKHHVFAYILNNGVERFSDDGEPKGTGGMPILEILRKQGFSNVIVVVTRYFGGVLLGTGGLSRAYSDATLKALENAKISIMRECATANISISYTFYTPIEKIIKSNGGIIVNSNFGENVSMELILPIENYGKLKTECINTTANKCKIIRQDDIFYDIIT